MKQITGQDFANQTYWFLVCITAIFFIGIMVSMAIFLIKNRKAGLDMIWTMIPAILLILISGLGWVRFRDQHLNDLTFVGER